MRAMTRIWRVRAAILTVIGAVAVHQARFALAPRPHDHELAAIHGYLSWAMPAAAAALFLALVQVVVSLRRGGDAGATPSLPRGRFLWAAATVSLLCVFAAQESIEA